MRVLAAGLKSSQRRWAMYLYPVMLILLEFLMRSLLSIEAGAIIGPSLAAVGTSFAIPLTVKKPLTVAKLEKLKLTLKPTAYSQVIPMYITGTMTYTDEEEEQVRNMGNAFALLLMGIWAVTLVMTIKYSAWWTSPLAVALGLISSCTGLVLTEWSERKV
jgi:hypothetical protein